LLGRVSKPASLYERRIARISSRETISSAMPLSNPTLGPRASFRPSTARAYVRGNLYNNRINRPPNHLKTVEVCCICALKGVGWCH
jgi:hypothetical protein